VVTADIARHDEETSRKAGFNDWLLKPFKEKDIYKSILKHLPRTRIKAN
jgi:CheY-like chemotaxis protein